MPWSAGMSHTRKTRRFGSPEGWEDVDKGDWVRSLLKIMSLGRKNKPQTEIGPGDVLAGAQQRPV